MIFKNKELLIQVLNIVWHDRDCWYDVRMYAKNMYHHLVNCDKNEDWYVYYRTHTSSEYVHRHIVREYHYLIHSLNEFNRFKVS